MSATVVNGPPSPVKTPDTEPSVAKSPRNATTPASFMDGVRWSNERSWHRYQERAGAGLPVSGPGEALAGREALGEALMLGLRLRDGVELAQMARRYGLDPRSVFGEEIERFKSWELLEEKEGVLRLTRRGLLLSNNVFAEII